MKEGNKKKGMRVDRLGKKEGRHEGRKKGRNQVRKKGR